MARIRIKDLKIEQQLGMRALKGIKGGLIIYWRYPRPISWLTPENDKVRSATPIEIP